MPLQDRDFEILEHLMTYRVTTREVLHRQFFADADLNAVSKVTTRLIKSEHLVKHEFLANSVYFTFGRRAAKIFRVSARCTQPLGTQSLYTQFGILGYCFGEKPQRTRLRVATIQEKHPELLHKDVQASQYVVDASTTPSLLSFVRVDGGGTTEHVLRKIEADIKCRLEIPLCASLIQAGRFQIACVTLTEEKQKDLERKIPAQNFPCAVTVEVVPILRDLLAVLRDTP
ncbi:MAG: hypothetical protein R3C17_08610 [Planctomycetaceae bacterium]